MCNCAYIGVYNLCMYIHMYVCINVRTYVCWALESCLGALIADFTMGLYLIFCIVFLNNGKEEVKVTSSHPNLFLYTFTKQGGFQSHLYSFLFKRLSFEVKISTYE